MGEGWHAPSRRRTASSRCGQIETVRPVGPEVPHHPGHGKLKNLIRHRRHSSHSNRTPHTGADTYRRRGANRPVTRPWTSRGGSGAEEPAEQATGELAAQAQGAVGTAPVVLMGLLAMPARARATRHGD